MRRSRSVNALAYPVASDLTSYLAADGLSAGTLDLSSYVNAAIDDFEAQVGRQMLAPGLVYATGSGNVLSVINVGDLYVGETISVFGVGGTYTIQSIVGTTVTLTTNLTSAASNALVAEVRSYDPPTNKNGFLSIDEFVSVQSVFYAPAQATPTALVFGQDYDLHPATAPASGRPYAAIRFFSTRWWWPVSNPWSQNSLSVQIAGQFGFGTSIPRMAWAAMLARAAYLLTPGVAQSGNKGILSWGHDTDNAKLDPGFATYRKQRDEQYQTAVQTYKRRTRGAG